MSGQLLAVRWAAGENEDPKPIKLKGSKLLPNLLGHDAVTLRRTIRTRLKTPSEGFIRHECWHVKQQDGRFVRWLLKYLFQPKFRKQQEAEAQAKAFEPYPQFRAVARLG